MQEKIQEREGGELDYRDIYTPLSVAKEEIWRRWNDKELRKKVEDFLEGDVPECLKEKPKAYLAKHVVSPNFNFFRYLSSANKIGLDPVIPEYRKDKFTSINDDKYYLGKLFFYDGMGRNSGLKVKTDTIIDFSLFDGEEFDKMKTIHGEGFVDFHHRLLEFFIPGMSNNISDISDWIGRNGVTPNNYYLYFLSLFVCNAVLFENFLKKSESDKRFGLEVVLPNFKKIEKIFGVKPLIVSTVPVETESDPRWWYYPGETELAIK